MGLTLGVIGAGPGGYVAAIRAAQLGARVVVVEQEAIGGTCLNWGCIPTKTIKATAEALDQLRRIRELGIDLEGGFRPNLERIMARKNEVIGILAQGIRNIFKSYRIEYLKGRARLRDPRTLRVTGSSGDSRDWAVDRVIIASGSKPLVFPAFPYDGKHILSSNDALLLKDIPESILIIGGGVVGCEFAYIFQALGARVTVVEALPRVIGLPSIDEDCSKILQREMKKKKISLYLDKTVDATEVRNGSVKVTIGPSPFLQEVKEKDRRPIEVEVQKVLVSIGRQSNAENLGLKEMGLEVDAHGWIAAGDRMETNIPGVYAIGDALGPSRVMLAHVASTEGMVAAENIMGYDRRMHYDVVPSGIFTFPEVATVGLTESQAAEKGLEVRADTFPFRGLGKPQAMGEIAGQVKLVSDRRNGKVLGVHIIGPHATDLIAEGTLAVQLGATVQDLAHTIHAHPTLAEAVMEAAHKAVGAGLHGLKE